MAIREQFPHRSQAIWASKEDILQASKAIRDDIELGMEEKLQRLEVEIGLRATKMISDRMDQLISSDLRKGIQIEYNKVLETEVNKRIREELVKEHESMRKELDDLRTMNKSLQEDNKELLSNFNKQVGFLHNLVKETMERMAELVQSLQPPPVTVSFPEQAVKVNLEASPVVVNVPESPAPIVNVEIPPPRLIKKSIQYDEYGRPCGVEEKELDV
jgi:hypothetical protein